MRLDLFLLAVFVAAITAAGDALCLAAARGSRVWVVGDTRLLLVLATLLWAACGPVWYHLFVRSKGEFIEPAAACSAAGVFFTVVIALASRSAITRGQWAGFAIVMIGEVIFALSAPMRRGN